MLYAAIDRTLTALQLAANILDYQAMPHRGGYVDECISTWSDMLDGLTVAEGC